MLETSPEPANPRLITCEEPPPLDELSAGDRVICGTDFGIEDYVEQARQRGIEVHHGAYRYQQERVVPKTAKRQAVIHSYTSLVDRSGDLPAYVDKHSVSHAQEAFEATWEALSRPVEANPTYRDAHDFLPADWITYLPFPTLNPAQVEAAPHIVDPAHRNLFVVAPTGTGKTVIGMTSALKAIRERGKKAAWLVPQRSLTAELDRELEAWRGQGLKVVALSGETATDQKATQDADLWVATTEKFEALCRSSSMRETIAEIDTIVVDEIHLLGDPGRGATLESLLARVRAETLPVRIVGLSATAANATDVADWLDAQMVSTSWRPTRQTQQMLLIPSGTRAEMQSDRHKVTSRIVSDVTLDDGSVLVFCGSKNAVRQSALAIARSRGVDIAGVNPDDADAVYAATHEAGIGLHYSDWRWKNDSVAEFDQRKTDVLVATSTLAAGVNLPARTVIVEDPNIGPNRMEVSMVQQMFGRAGRAGKENEGWAYLIGDHTDLLYWREQIATGYTIESSIGATLDDHLLGEIVQKNVTTTDEAEQWWTHTFAYHEGTDGNTALAKAQETLTKFGFVTATDTDQDTGLEATRLGRITSRMMVSVRDVKNIIMALNGPKAPGTPKNLNQAEDTLVEQVCKATKALSDAQSARGDQASKVRRILDAKGDVTKLPEGRKALNRNGVDTLPGNQVSQAGLLLALRSPHTFKTKGGYVVGVNRTLFNPAIHDSTRLFAWMAAVGPLGVLPAWASHLATDIGARVRWVSLSPARGHGRLLAACERAVPRSRASRLVPALYAEARTADVLDPSQLVKASSATGVTPSRLQKVARESARREKTGFGSSTVAYVHGGEGKWFLLKPGESIGRRLAVGFHSSGDSLGTGWMAYRE